MAMNSQVVATHQEPMSIWAPQVTCIHMLTQQPFAGVLGAMVQLLVQGRLPDQWYSKCLSSCEGSHANIST
eukprot:4487343-Amphidinium_carterae.1